MFQEGTQDVQLSGEEHSEQGGQLAVEKHHQISQVRHRLAVGNREFKLYLIFSLHTYVAKKSIWKCGISLSDGVYRKMQKGK